MELLPLLELQVGNYLLGVTKIIQMRASNPPEFIRVVLNAGIPLLFLNNLQEVCDFFLHFFLSQIQDHQPLCADSHIHITI